MSSGEAKAPTFLSPLEGLRGIAAVGVVLYHSWYHWQINRIGIVEHGDLFVDLFFVISGFVISHIYTRRLRSTPDFAEFAILRTARLYPLHLFTLLVLAAYTLASAWAATHWGLRFPHSHSDMVGNNGLGYFFEHLLLLQGLLSPNIASFNSPSWSISTEYFTYFIFAFAVLMAARFRLFPVLLALLALVPLAYLFQQGELTADSRILRCIAGFFTGTLVYLAWARFHPGLRRRLAGRAAHALELTVAALTLAAVSCCGKGRAQFLVIPCFALLVFLLADGGGLVARFLKYRPIQALGRWSYSIYMVHFAVILVMGDLARRFWTHGPGAFKFWDVWQTLPVTALLLVVVLVVASLTYRFIEDPPRRWAKRWVARRRGEPVTAVPDASIGGP